jgi:Ser/Thr protein kinase RdoA (MazF antagonist)
VSLHAAELPEEVRTAYGWGDAHVRQIAGGLINSTFAVERDGAPIAVVQRLHAVFGPTVNLDLDAVTTHLAAKGMLTPRLIRTREGAAWIDVDGKSWRALTWVDGETVHAVPDLAWAEAGGELVGRFHLAVADLNHTYAFSRAGVHDTAAHLARLTACAIGPGDAEWKDLAKRILDAAESLPPMPSTPKRHCHGDLKISNLLFTPAGRGRCLVDLDTLGLGTMAFELGDAMRSWCNPHGEDAGSVSFDLAIFCAAIRGVRSVADALLTSDERTSIVIGLETVCIELAARFCVDVFRDEYFGWNPQKFASRREHNLVRAEGQLALGLAVRASRDAALDAVHA